MVNWAENRITNGIPESFDSLFQADKAKARGYRETETLKALESNWLSGRNSPLVVHRKCQADGNKKIGFQYIRHVDRNT